MALQMTPNPPDKELWRALCTIAGSQREAARLLHVDERTMRRWCAGDRQGPWAAAELLRRMLMQT